jgi:hypothetical protein
VERHKYQIAEVSKSQLSINDCMKTIGIQEEMIKVLTDKVNKLQANNMTVIGGRSPGSDYHAYPLVGINTGYQVHNQDIQKNTIRDVYMGDFNRKWISERDTYDCNDKNVYRGVPNYDPRADSKYTQKEFICHLSNSIKKN